MSGRYRALCGSTCSVILRCASLLRWSESDTRDVDCQGPTSDADGPGRMWGMSESAATWFRRARLRAGYRSQGELARVLGLSRAAVANWESETVRGRPSRSVLPNLSRLLSVPPEELAARYGIDVERPIAGRSTSIP